MILPPSDPIDTLAAFIRRRWWVVAILAVVLVALAVILPRIVAGLLAGAAASAGAVYASGRTQRATIASSRRRQRLEIQKAGEIQKRVEAEQRKSAADAIDRLNDRFPKKPDA